MFILNIPMWVSKSPDLIIDFVCQLIFFDKVGMDAASWFPCPRQMSSYSPSNFALSLYGGDTVINNAGHTAHLFLPH